MRPLDALDEVRGPGRKTGEEPELNTIAFEKGKEVAFNLRELLTTMGLDAIVKALWPAQPASVVSAVLRSRWKGSGACQSAW